MIEYITDDGRLNERRQIEKKVLPEYYKGISTHKKMFEIRKDDDGIKPGDILVLREWDGEKYTGGRTRREVTAVLRNCPEYGLMDGYCIMSLQVPGWNFITPQACLDDEVMAINVQRGIAKMEIGKSKSGITMWYKCSECGEPVDLNDNFCRNCGRIFEKVSDK